MSLVYKIDDIIRFEFFKMPKALFANPKYKIMSSDAKLTYSLLYDRLSLSKQNGWINENNEVFLIYTRDEIADALGVTYKKAMSAFRELISNGLIFEKRCGRGMANKIYIVKPEIVSEAQSTERKAQSIERIAQSSDDGLSDILENCQLQYFDEETQITFHDAIERLWYCERFKIGDSVLPRANVRSRMRRLDYSVLQSTLYNLHQNTDKPIRNITAYVMI